MHNERRLNPRESSTGSVGFKKEHLTSVLCVKVASHGRHLGVYVWLRVLCLLGPTEGERAAQAPGLAAVVRGLILLLLLRLVANLRRYLAFGVVFISLKNECSGSVNISLGSGSLSAHP